MHYNRTSLIRTPLGPWKLSWLTGCPHFRRLIFYASILHMKIRLYISTLQAYIEPHNIVDQLAVSVVRSGRIVGNVPFNLAPVFSHFLKRSFNKGTAEITGEKVNRGGGYGLEVPCIYRLYGPKTYVERAKTMLSSNQSRERPYGVSGLSQNWMSVLTVQLYYYSVLKYLISCIQFCPHCRIVGCPYFRGWIIQLWLGMQSVPTWSIHYSEVSHFGGSDYRGSTVVKLLNIKQFSNWNACTWLQNTLNNVLLS